MIKELLVTKQYVEFLVGRDGDFDLLVASVIRRCKRECRSDNSSLVWVLPYITADFRNNEESYREYFDEVEVFSGAHYKSAFQQRNRDMVLCEALHNTIAMFCPIHKLGYQTGNVIRKRTKM